MLKIKDRFQKLFVSIAGSASFILYKDQLFAKKTLSAKNDRVHYHSQIVFIAV